MKNLTKFAAILLLIVMAALIALSGTYAKYTTEVTGTSTATVAKFAVGGVTSDSFKLFETILDTKDEKTETDVLAGKIAPGTSGQFAVTLTNASEVAVTYDLKFVASNTTLPIEYSLDGQTYKSAAELNATGITLAEGNTDVTVYWRWPFEGNDDTDTTLGQNPVDLTVTTTVTFTQVD